MTLWRRATPFYNGTVLGRVADFRRRLLGWYDRSRRQLPWRVAPGSDAAPDPYHVLVSETMLQQTQVATVVPYFLRFIERFPTFAALAAAPRQDVLRLWQGLGYYSRARNLQAAAQAVVAMPDGKLPSQPEELLELPGIGRYTAGAIASIAFGRRAPVLDGNVMRVLCRLDKVVADPRERPTNQLLWRRAEEVLPEKRIGDFNSALMELGATVCTPRNPQCLLCPVARHCEAAAAGVQARIPAPRKSRPTPLHRRRTYCIVRGNRLLIEQRPPTGRWAGMWQFITFDADGADGHPRGLVDARRLGEVSHALTHRRYEFQVFLADAKSGKLPPSDNPRRWVSTQEIDRYPLPRPHLKILEMFRAHRNTSQ